MKIELMLRGVSRGRIKKKVKTFNSTEDLYKYIYNYNSSKSYHEFFIFDFNVL